MRSPGTTNRSPSARRSGFIDPAALMRIKSLELRAKTVVEGLWAGLNRSPFHGFSVEFTEYRQYTPGDDLRYLDWRLYARSDRDYVKRFEDETNLRCHLIVDMSRSMAFGSLGYTKDDYAKTLAATLGYFLSTQRDAVGLVTFDERIEEFIPARYRVGHLRRLMLALERQPAGRSTNVIAPLEQVAQRVRRRGLLIVVSDLLTPVEELETYLGYLRARGQEVVVFQVLDPAELDFDFQEPVLFRDLESGREVYVDPASARETYRRRLAEHLQSIETCCGRLGITHRRITTNSPLDQVLAEFLHAREIKSSGPVRERRRSM